MSPYFCRLCGMYDEQGIGGHAQRRCHPPAADPLAPAARTPGAHIVREPVVIVKPKRKPGVYRDKVKRKTYMRTLMRARRAKAQGVADGLR